MVIGTGASVIFEAAVVYATWYIDRLGQTDPAAWTFVIGTLIAGGFLIHTWTPEANSGGQDGQGPDGPPSDPVLPVLPEPPKSQAPVSSEPVDRSEYPPYDGPTGRIDPEILRQAERRSRRRKRR